MTLTVPARNGASGADRLDHSAESPHLDVPGEKPPLAKIKPTALRPEVKRFFSPSEAAAILPGGRTDPWTVIRWISKGILHEGRPVRLAALKVGGRWQIAVEDLEAFLAVINPSRGQPVEIRPVAPGPRRSTLAARRRHRDSIRFLVSQGVMDPPKGHNDEL